RFHKTVAWLARRSSSWADGHLNWTFLQSEIALKMMSRRCDFNMKLSSANLASICWTILWLLCPIALSAQVTSNCVAPPACLMAWWTGDASDFAGTNNGVLMNGATATPNPQDPKPALFPGFLEGRRVENWSLF